MIVRITILLLMVILIAAPFQARAELVFQRIAAISDTPVAIAPAGDGSGRLFVALQRGRIIVVKGANRPTPTFLDISSLVSCCGERGLLSIAFHPRFERNGFFFVNYTDVNGDTVVARYRVSANPDRADPVSAEIILRVDQPFASHNGGLLLFGPDGFLYIGLGDGGGLGDPGNRAQNLGTLLGKLLRIDVNGPLPYRIPPDNPFVGVGGARPEIWARGLRNPWRFSFDRLTHDLFIADVGQRRFEEVDFQPAASRGGENYGWRRMEGRHCYIPSTNCNPGGLVLPIIEYSHTFGCSITGGFVYRGSSIPALRGTYLYGDFCSGRIWGARRGAAGRWSARQLDQTGFRITTFGEDGGGELYVGDSSGGRILKIVGLTP